ncbi:MAG: hypothetical protein IJN37_03180 [Clostridia bacterium]|nr:hypothetical protein [Clostridia bacterium]
MKRIVSLMLVCVLSLTIIPQSNAVTQRELNEENATMYNTEMITYFEQEVGYPDHYGGAWLNQNSGHLVIGLTERNEEIEQYYYDVTGADILEFETVEYSLQELYDAMVETAENVSRTRSLPQVNGGAIMQSTNSVDMYVSEEEAVSYISKAEVTPLPQNELNNVKSNADIINFKISEKSGLEASVANVGEGHRIDDGSDPNAAPIRYDGSLGYLAYRTVNNVRQVGIVTVAHTYNNLDLPFYAYTPDATYIGQATFKRWPNNIHTVYDIDDLGTRDFVFIHFNGNNTVSPVIKYDTIYSQDLTTGAVIPAELSPINKSGESTHYSSGLIESIYYYTSLDYNGVAPTVQRIMSTYNSENGDSGGIVYKRGVNGKAYVIGIHQGYKTINGRDYALAIPSLFLEACGIYPGQ